MLHPNTRHTYSNNLGDSRVITFQSMSILYLIKAPVRLISAWVQALPQTNDADSWERRRGRSVSQCLSGGEGQACAHFKWGEPVTVVPADVFVLAAHHAMTFFHVLTEVRSGGGTNGERGTEGPCARAKRACWERCDVGR